MKWKYTIGLAMVLALSQGQADMAEIDSHSVAAHFDSKIKSAIDDSLIVAATVGVTSDAKDLFLRAYGTRDIQSGAGVDVNRTLFRIGSISKIFTAIIALQLVEEGVLDLDTDLNQYLRRFTVPKTFREPITARHILNHSSGLASEIDHLKEVSIRSGPMEVIDFERSLRRVHPPGKFRYYDNLGVGLLGLVIADIEGKSFPQVAKDRIFKPLGMVNTAAALQEERLTTAVACHELGGDDKWSICEHEVLRELAQSSGDASTTARDMNRFMKVLLNNGQYSGGTLLSSENFAVLMDTNMNRVHPLVSGLSFMFEEVGPVGHGAVGKPGGIRGFSAHFLISPRDQIGIFLAVAGDTSSAAGFFPSLMAGEPSEMQDLSAAISTEIVLSGIDYLNKIAVGDRQDAGGIPALPNLIRFTNEELIGFEGRYTPLILLGSSTLARRIISTIAAVDITFNSATTSLTINGKGPWLQSAPQVFESSGSDTRVTFYHAGDRLIVAGGALSHAAKRFWYERPLYTILPLAIFGFLILTSVAYLSSKNVVLRRTCGLLTCSILIFLAAIALELQYGGDAIFGMRPQAFAWRFGMHLAAIGLLFAAWQLIFRNSLLSSQARFPVVMRAYLILLALSSVGMILWSLYWRVLGTFSGY